MTTVVPSTQRYINIAQIKNGVVVTKTGSVRQVIHVEPVNFALKSEEEQNIIVGQYQNFLNSLNFPIQIVLHSRRLDVAPYILQLKEKMSNITNELLRYYSAEYIDFIQNLTSMTNIMDKKFFVVVGYNPAHKSKTGILGSFFGKKEQNQLTFIQKDWDKYTTELAQRTSLVVSGLNALGLKSDVLDTQKTIELYYNVFNPEEGVAEKLTDAASLQAPVISTKNNIDPSVLSENINMESNNTKIHNPAHNLNQEQSPNNETKQ